MTHSGHGRPEPFKKDEPIPCARVNNEYLHLFFQCQPSRPSKEPSAQLCLCFGATTWRRRRRVFGAPEYKSSVYRFSLLYFFYPSTTITISYYAIRTVAMPPEKYLSSNRARAELVCLTTRIVLNSKRSMFLRVSIGKAAAARRGTIPPAGKRGKRRVV